ncbi:22781_t:CDS:2 [Rhizophagus irregularis]|nr:22781_t:CDS:2 [Rhizophagus irregularis]
MSKRSKVEKVEKVEEVAKSNVKNMNEELKQFVDDDKHFSLVRNFHLADIITLANGACGSSSIFLSIQYMITKDKNFLWMSLLLMPLGMMFDLFDGKVARWRRTAICAFAVGMRTFLDSIVLVVFISCGIARLARYNATVASLPKDKSGKVHYFEGTPIPTTLCIMALVAYLANNGYIEDNLPGGIIKLPINFDFHPFVLLFGLMGITMLSNFYCP